MSFMRRDRKGNLSELEALRKASMEFSGRHKTDYVMASGWKTRGPEGEG